MASYDDEDVFSSPGEYKEYHSSEIDSIRAASWALGFGLGFLLGILVMSYVLLH